MVADYRRRLLQGVHDFQPKFHVFGCLLVVLILGLLLVQFRGPKSRYLSLLGLGALFWSVWSEWLPLVTLATSSYWNGRARMRSGALSNPDPATRIPVVGSCAGPPYNEWWNETMLLNARLFGPPPGSYIGPYPTQIAAADLLRRRGEVPTIKGSRLVLQSGITYRVIDTTRYWWQHVQNVGLTNLHFEMGLVRRVAYLSDISLLTETDETIELRLWDEQNMGYVWARWDK